MCWKKWKVVELEKKYLFQKWFRGFTFVFEYYFITMTGTAQRSSNTSSIDFTSKSQKKIKLKFQSQMFLGHTIICTLHFVKSNCMQNCKKKKKTEPTLVL